jgi:hypothetical protein
LSATDVSGSIRSSFLGILGPGERLLPGSPFRFNLWRFSRGSADRMIGKNRAFEWDSVPNHAGYGSKLDSE